MVTLLFTYNEKVQKHSSNGQHSQFDSQPLHREVKVEQPVEPDEPIKIANLKPPGANHKRHHNAFDPRKVSRFVILIFS